MAVAIINWNTRDLLRACLATVLAERAEEVVVVDNGSYDGSIEMVRREFPTVRLKVLPSNPGYGAASNIAFRLCTVIIYAVVGLWLWRTRCQVVIDVCGKLHPLLEQPRTIGIVFAVVVLSVIVAPLMALAIVGDLR
jgi:GT2 family glycosyltransferase